MKSQILSRLHEIEAEENVRIVYACESGSRAWGFPSADSDYDVRFLYVRPMEWYGARYALRTLDVDFAVHIGHTQGQLRADLKQLITGPPFFYFFPLVGACGPFSRSFRLLSRLLRLRSSSFFRSIRLCLPIKPPRYLVHSAFRPDDVHGVNRGRLHRRVDPCQDTGSDRRGKSRQEPAD